MESEGKILLSVSLFRSSTGSFLHFACTVDEYDFLEELYPGWEVVKT